MITEEEWEAKEALFHQSWAIQDSIYMTCNVDLAPYEEPNEECCRKECPDYEHRFLWCQEAARYRQAADHMESFARSWADGCIAYEDGEWVMSIVPMNDPVEARRRIEGMFSSDVEPLDIEGNMLLDGSGQQELIKQLFGFKLKIDPDED